MNTANELLRDGRGWSGHGSGRSFFALLLFLLLRLFRLLALLLFLFGFRWGDGWSGYWRRGLGRVDRRSRCGRIDGWSRDGSCGWSRGGSIGREGEASDKEEGEEGGAHRSVVIKPL